MPESKPWYKKSGLIILGIIVICALVLLVLHNHANSSPSIVNEDYAPTDSSANDSESSDRVNLERLKSFVHASQSTAVDTTALDSQINSIVSANKDVTIGVSIKDLKTGAVHNYGHQGAMTAASVTKVLTAADYLKQVELGNKSLDTVMSNGKTAQTNIEQMIVVSDNDAWHVLNDSLGYSQLQGYADSLGLSSYYYTDNTIGVSDVTRLLGELYTRKLLNESNTQLLLSYMERANYRDLIIPAVPATDTVYHKAGALYGYLHDAAIITNTNQAIVLTIFTNTPTNFSKSRSASIMQQITTPTLTTFQLN